MAFLNYAFTSEMNSSEIFVKDSTIKQLWELDSIGIKDSENGDVDPVMQHFNCNVEFVNGHYEVALPFNSRKNELLSNKTLALNRLEKLNRGLKANPDLFSAYNNVVKEYESFLVLLRKLMNFLRVI